MYTKFWAEWRDYSDKTSRKDFWEITLINLIITILVGGMQLVHETNRYINSAHVHWLQPQTYSVLLIWLVLLTIPSVAMIARRYTDVGAPKIGMSIALTFELTMIVSGLAIAFFIFKDFGAIYANIDISQIEAGKAARLIKDIYKVLGAVIVFTNIYMLIILVSPSDVQIKLNAADEANRRKLNQIKNK